MPKLSVGIVGMGNFGPVLAKLFARPSSNIEFEIKLFSSRVAPDYVQYYPLVEVVNCDLVFPTVPISSLQSWLKEIVPMLQLGENSPLFCDICSVKQMPTSWFLNTLPERVDVASTHPLFGPTSTKSGTEFAGLRWVSFPSRVRNRLKYEQLLEFLREQELNVLDLSPELHDQYIARTQAFGFLVGRIGIEMGIERTPVDTKWFEHLFLNQESVSQDTEQLFLDMFRYNPEAVKMLDQFASALDKLKSKIK